MSGASNFAIRYAAKYETTYSKIFRTHYRQSQEDADEFERLLDEIEEALVEDPLLHNATQMPWPRGTSRAGCELYKLKFAMPGLRGASKLGRLLYLVDRTNREIYFLWIYTHQEHKKQPRDKEFKQVLHSVFRHFNH